MTVFYQHMLAALPHIISGVVVFLLFWLGAVCLKYIITRLSKQSKHRSYLLKLIAQVAKTALIIFGLISALGTMGVNVSALVASLGLVGFALGFAFKDALSNMLAGFMILFYRPFRIGDVIEVSKMSGKVLDVDLRYTTLQNDTQRHLVPNATLLSNIVSVKQPEATV